MKKLFVCYTSTTSSHEPHKRIVIDWPKAIKNEADVVELERHIYENVHEFLWANILVVSWQRVEE